MPQLLQITVKDAVTGLPVAGATVKIDTVTFTTDAEGRMSTNLTIGKSYTYTISKTGYATKTVPFTMPSYQYILIPKLTPVAPPPPAPVTYALTISVVGLGSTSPAPGYYTKPAGTVTSMAATPKSGWELDKWTVNGSFAGSDPTLKVTSDADKIVQAIFSEVVTVPPTPPPPAPPPKVGEVPAPPQTGNPVLQPLVDAVWWVWSSFLGLLRWIGGALVAGIQDTAKGLYDQIILSVAPGSPDKEAEERAKKLAEIYRRRIEEAASKLVSKSVDIDKAPGVAWEVLGILLGVEIGTGAAMMAADAIHPLKDTGMKHSGSRIMDMLGVMDTGKMLAMQPAAIGVLQPLTYYYNRLYTPLIPSLGDLITMLVREVIDPTEYADYAAWHGESRKWADRRWEAHWRTVAPEMLHDAYHRDIIDESQWSSGIVFNDYKPEPRRPDWTSDLDVVRGLRKTLIPRVDLRRGWELGLLGDDRLLKGYVDLGYEEDADLMAGIQKATALDAEITMLKREYLAWFERGLTTETVFIKRLKDLDKLRPREWYWVQLGRLRRARKAEEPLPAVYAVAEA